MSALLRQTRRGPDLPGWIPEMVRAYLAHTEGGESLRALARASGGHASTVLRQVRRTELLRDDPLADAALTRLGQLWQARAGFGPKMFAAQDSMPMTSRFPDDVTISRESLRVLKALLEPDTLLIVAEGVEDAIVVKNSGADRPVRRAVLTTAVAEALALRGFIAGKASGRIARYAITAAGRAEANRLMAEAESRRAAGAGQADDADASVELFPSPPRERGANRTRRRAVGAETPLHVLTRRKRGDGSPWLTAELVAAGVRFRESFEIARLGGQITQDWERLITGRVSNGNAAVAGTGPTRRLEAERSLEAAIVALGPDLAETVILSVCEEHGMEMVEAKLDFPARSGKIVLRIALRRLAHHYDENGSEDFDLIY